MLLDDDQALDARRAQLLRTVNGRHAVLVEPDLGAGTGAATAATRFAGRFAAVFPAGDRPPPPEPVSSYLRCWLSPAEIRVLLDADAADPAGPSVYRIWPDYVLRPHLDRSVTTVSADAAWRVYAAGGEGIAWAVVDSGIEAGHPHFSDGTLTDPQVACLHRDYTYLVTGDQPPAAADPAAALADPVGHGTHVAGIIAGQLPAAGQAVIAGTRPSADGLPAWAAAPPAAAAGSPGSRRRPGWSACGSSPPTRPTPPPARPPSPARSSPRWPGCGRSTPTAGCCASTG